LEYCNIYEKSIRPIIHLESIDEFYLDVTALVDSVMKNSNGKEKEAVNLEDIGGLKYKFVVENANGPLDAKHWKPKDTAEERLFHGLKIASEVIKIIRDKTGLDASVGIGSNKLIAKLACGLNKPLAVTLVLAEGFSQVCKRIPIPNVPGLGGAAGKAIMKNLKVAPELGHGDSNESVPVASMGDLTPFTMSQLASVRLKEDGPHLIGTRKGQCIYDTVRGIDDTPITQKLKHP
jgi:nucleotidyltransferase/DNA polymerase involved in DNA repair